ncbi:hypothetical protein V8F20_011011 [Naviculisporaceae sp. PSN 640]
MKSLYLRLQIPFLALGVIANPLPGGIRPTPAWTSTRPCTTYITKIIPGIYMPETVYTVYTTTETVFALVPCKGCVLATTTLYAPGVGGGGGWPYEETTTTTTATTPSKTTSTICIPSHRPKLPTVLRRQVLERDHGTELEQAVDDPDLEVSAQLPPTAATVETKTKGDNCPEYIFPIPTSTDSISKPVITLPGAGRTNPIEPTTTYAILRERGPVEVHQD